MRATLGSTAASSVRAYGIVSSVVTLAYAVATPSSASSAATSPDSPPRV